MDQPLPGQQIKIPPPGWKPGDTANATTTRLSNPTPVTTADGAAPNGAAQQALDWSRAQMDPATATGVNSNNGLTAQQDPKAWNNWCLAFVSTAYGRKVPELRAGSAIQSYRNFEAAGKIVNSRDIPAGAPVFFNTTANNQYGHIAIATGRTDANGDAPPSSPAHTHYRPRDTAGDEG